MEFTDDQLTILYNALHYYKASAEEDLLSDNVERVLDAEATIEDIEVMQRWLDAEIKMRG